MPKINVPRLLTLLRELDDQNFRSGTWLAERLGLSRASVNLTLRDAETLGIPLQRLRGSGYRLAEAQSWLDSETIRHHLGDLPVQVDVLDEIDSTNSELMRRGALPNGYCLCAECQTAGRGRWGRQWLAQPGASLAFSLVWNGDGGLADLTGLSLVVGVGIARALRDLGIGDVKLKWPNDVIVDFQKLAGTLIEVRGDAMGPCQAIIGIGVNVALTMAARSRIGQPATSMQQYLPAPLDRNQILASLLRQLWLTLEQFKQQGFAAFAAEWQDWHAYEGLPVEVRFASGETANGRVRGIGPAGELLLATAQGQRLFASGEVSLRRETP